MDGVTIRVERGTEDDYPASVSIDPDIEWTDDLTGEAIAAFLRETVDQALEKGVSPAAFQMAVMRAMTGG